MDAYVIKPCAKTCANIEPHALMLYCGGTTFISWLPCPPVHMFFVINVLVHHRYTYVLLASTKSEQANTIMGLSTLSHVERSLQLCKINYYKATGIWQLSSHAYRYIDV
jgi:hypothetical protein